MANTPERKTAPVTIEHIRAARKAAAQKRELPGGAARLHPFHGTMRARLVSRNGHDFYEVDGYATVFERGYDMYDEFGPYKEVADTHMLDVSLGKKPDVAFLLNHRGMTMARTTNGTLDLTRDEIGLAVHAYLNAERSDVRDLASAIRDGLVDEMSFAFMLQDGKWNDDFTEFRITQADINRGDVSAVNYGANPYTSISARSAEWLQMVDRVPASIARAAVTKLTKRTDLSDLDLSELLKGIADWEVEDLTVEVEVEPPDEEAEEVEPGEPMAESAPETPETVERSSGTPATGDDFARARAALLALDEW